jgi:hypothetical protein
MMEPEGDADADEMGGCLRRGPVRAPFQESAVYGKEILCRRGGRRAASSHPSGATVLGEEG